MAIGLYKPGQGYWTRVLTATAIGVITLAAAAWAWSQMSVVAEKLPRNVWVLKVKNSEGDIPNPGETVQLVREGGAGQAAGEREVLGTARVRSWDSSSQELQTDGWAVSAAGTDPSLATLVRNDGAGGKSFKAEIPERARGMSSISPELLSGSVAALVILLGFLIAYYFCAIRRGSVEFLIATDMEMKKVNWSTKKDIISSTWVVVMASLLIAGALFVVDLAFQQFFRMIGVLV